LVTAGNLVGQTDATLLTSIVSLDPLYVYFDAPERDFIEYQKGLQEQVAANPNTTKFPVEVGLASEDGFPHAGIIDFQENRVDTGTGTIRIRGKLQNPFVKPRNIRLLYPGLFVRVRVPIGSKKEQLVIPEDALMTGQEGKFVYVVDKDNMVQKRTVTLGTGVWRAKEAGSTAPTEWVLHQSNPKPAGPPPEGAAPPPAAKGPPPEPAPTTVSARSVVAITKGLAAGDVVIVKGLQKARPGAPVTPDIWDLRPPTK
jgi:multidrug efflux system membrane fusion protein